MVVALFRGMNATSKGNDMKNIFKNAMRLRRYQGNAHGKPGGMSISIDEAFEAIRIVTDLRPGYDPSNGVDELAKKEPGMNCRKTNIFLEFANNGRS